MTATVSELNPKSASRCDDNDANGDGKAASDDVMRMADLYKSIKEMKCSGIPSIWDRDRY